MQQLEQNIVASFELVKEDFAKVRRMIAYLSEEQQKLQTEIAFLKRQKKQLTQKTVIKRARSTRKRYIASRKGTCVHAEHSIFAKNIKSENRIIFKTLKAALNQGYKLGESLKR